MSSNGKTCSLVFLALVTLFEKSFQDNDVSNIVEPSPWLNGVSCQPNQQLQQVSPDPFVACGWSDSTNQTPVQLYNATMPTAWLTVPPSGAFDNMSSILTGKPYIIVKASGWIRFDFGVERAGWVEFETHDISPEQAKNLRASISEYNEPWDGKTRQVTRYANGIFRLETNDQLYEGVRFVWIFVDTPIAAEGSKAVEIQYPEWHISAVRVVSRVKPVNYTGVYFTNDQVLNAAWYTGAYGSRLNMENDAFNSILMDRGDRVSIQGDGNPTMAAALSAFSGLETFRLMSEMLNATNSGFVHGHHVVDQEIMAYPILWGMSVNNYLWHSGDTATFLKFAPDVGSIIDKAIDSFLEPKLNIGWMGWDDRLGNGFCGTCNEEAQLTFATLVIRACHDFAESLASAGDQVNALKYRAHFLRLTSDLRTNYKTFDSFGLHAGANLINARVPSESEAQELFSRIFNDPVTVCSWSNFNQFWILQALNNMGMRDYAIGVIRLCWGPMTNAWDNKEQWGRGCFWELSSPEWTRFIHEGDKAPTRPSYCHPWSSGVTHFLSNDLAGILPLQPGFKSFAVIPHISLSCNKTFAKHGPVTINVTRSQLTGITADANYSIGIKIVVFSTSLTFDGSVIGLRHKEEGSKCTLDTSSITLNGVSVPAFAYDDQLLGRIHPLLGSMLGFVNISAAGTVYARYTCEVDGVSDLQVSPCTGIDHCPPFSSPSYQASWVRQKYSGGSWINKFGSLGYILFAFMNGTDIRKLPEFVVSTNVVGSSKFVGSDPNNQSYLTDPSALSSTRKLGFVTAGADGSQGTLLDINTIQNTRPFNITLYFAANVKPIGSNSWSATRQSIRTLDFRSMNVIAKEPLLTDMGEGSYYTLSNVTGSLRLRVMPIDNDAGFSAVFFD